LLPASRLLLAFLLLFVPPLIIGHLCCCFRLVFGVRALVVFFYGKATVSNFLIPFCCRHPYCRWRPCFYLQFLLSLASLLLLAIPDVAGIPAILLAIPAGAGVTAITCNSCWRWRHCYYLQFLLSLASLLLAIPAVAGVPAIPGKPTGA
jgi:hypothetical protein